MSALAFLGWNRLLTRRLCAALGAVPAVVVPLIVINPGHAMIVDPAIVTTQGIRAFEHSFPPLFVLFLARALGLATLSASLIAYGALGGTLPWRPALIAVVVFLLPIIVVLKIGGVCPPAGTGITVTARTALNRTETLVDEIPALARKGDPIADPETVSLSSVSTQVWAMVGTRVGALAASTGFCVADNGAGVSEADRDEMFEFGYSTAEDGTGFGLAIGTEIAEAHGWERHVTDNEEGGTRFEITGDGFAD